MKKRTLALLLVLVLLVSSLPVSAASAESTIVTVDKISANVIGYPPVIGTQSSRLIFNFTGNYSDVFEVSFQHAVGNEGWLSLRPGADSYDNVTQFEAGVDYYYKADIRMKQEYVETHMIASSGALQLDIRDANGNPIHLSNRPYVSNWGTPSVSVTFGPIRAVEHGVTPLADLVLSLDQPIKLEHGEPLPQPVLSSNITGLQYLPDQSIWYWDDGEAPVECDADDSVMPNRDYTLEAVLRLDSPDFIPLPKEGLSVWVDNVKWWVFSVTTSGSKSDIHIGSPSICSSDNRTRISALELEVQNATPVLGQPLGPVEVILDADSPYACTNSRWMKYDAAINDYDYYTSRDPVEDGKYALELTLEIREDAQDTYVGSLNSTVTINGKECTSRVTFDRCGGTICTARLCDISPVPNDTALTMTRRPDQRVYSPGENFDPAGMELAITSGGSSKPISDWTLEENTDLRADQDHVLARWKNLTVEIPIVVAEGCPFLDVEEGRSAYDPVIWAVHNGITSGITSQRFGPDTTCTRGMIVTFLWRYAGCPQPISTESRFTDVPSGSYCSDAVRWAVEQGITTGATATRFNPDKNCTRGQMVTFLWRFLGKPAPAGDGPEFTDLAPGASYVDAVRWAVTAGITRGMSSTRFGPDAPCTRGHAVTFLYRL